MDARIPTGRDDNVTTGGLRIKFPADGRTYPGRGRIATAGRIAAISLPRSLHKVHPADFVEGAAAHPVIIDARRERGGVEGHAGPCPSRRPERRHLGECRTPDADRFPVDVKMVVAGLNNSDSSAAGEPVRQIPGGDTRPSG